MSERFSKTKNFTGVKKNLLKGSNFKSIQQVRREYPNLSDNEIYQNLFDFIIETDRQKRKKKEDKKKAKEIFEKADTTYTGQQNKKLKHYTSDIKRFKNAANEIKFENPQAKLIKNGGLLGLENNTTTSISKEPKEALKILYSSYKTIKQLIQEKRPIKFYN